MKNHELIEILMEVPAGATIFLANRVDSVIAPILAVGTDGADNEKRPFITIVGDIQTFEKTGD